MPTLLRGARRHRFCRSRDHLGHRDHCRRNPRRRLPSRRRGRGRRGVRQPPRAAAAPVRGRSPTTSAAIRPIRTCRRATPGDARTRRRGAGLLNARGAPPELRSRSRRAGGRPAAQIRADRSPALARGLFPPVRRRSSISGSSTIRASPTGCSVRCRSGPSRSSWSWRSARSSSGGGAAIRRWCAPGSPSASAARSPMRSTVSFTARSPISSISTSGEWSFLHLQCRRRGDHLGRRAAVARSPRDRAAAGRKPGMNQLLPESGLRRQARAISLPVGVEGNIHGV